MNTSKFESLFFDDKVIYIFVHSSGVYLCPVCGHVEASLMASPWLQCPNRKIMPHHGSGCSCCATSFGDDDEYALGESPVDSWNRLRAQWLRKVGFNIAIREQLRNIGVEIDDQGNQISDINLNQPAGE